MAEGKDKSLQATLEHLERRMDECRAVRQGDIDLHLSGKSSGDYRLSSGNGKTSITTATCSGAGRGPLIEIWGDADVIRAIIDGEKDPVKQFLAGKMRVRGNLRYLSEIGVELGILEKPL